MKLETYFHYVRILAIGLLIVSGITESLVNPCGLDILNGAAAGLAIYAILRAGINREYKDLGNGEV